MSHSSRRQLCAGSLAALVAWCLRPSPAMGMEFGRFVGSVRVEFVDAGPGRGRTMRLLDDFTYIDPRGRRWTARKGYETDGASIPRAFWSIVGGPFEGTYRNAAVIHDWYCVQRGVPWQDVHRVFYYGCRAADVGSMRSKILYAAVMFGGPRWGGGASSCFASCHTVPDAWNRAARELTEQEARDLARWVETEDPTIEDIDARALRAPH